MCTVSCSAACRYAHVQLEAFAATINERVLNTPNNPISIALTLAHLRQVGPLSGPADQTDRNSQDSSNLQQGTSSTPASQSNRPTHVAPVTEHNSAPLRCEAAEVVETSARDLSMGNEAGQHISQASDGDTAVHTASAKKPSTFLGSMLFKRAVSGTRVVSRGKEQSVAGHCFKGYGAHCDVYPCDYLTFAAALGTTEGDVDEFIRRLGLCIKDFKRCNSN